MSSRTEQKPEAAAEEEEPAHRAEEGSEVAGISKVAIEAGGYKPVFLLLHPRRLEPLPQREHGSDPQDTADDREYEAGVTNRIAIERGDFTAVGIRRQPDQHESNPCRDHENPRIGNGCAAASGGEILRR